MGKLVKGTARKRSVRCFALKRRLVLRGSPDSGKCRRIVLRPPPPGRRRLGRSEPLVRKRFWPELPTWVALHADRGPRRKCWEGHSLQPDLHDGRRYGCCTKCWRTPAPGTPLMGCRICGWSRCVECTGGQRLPLIRDDPLFLDPHMPCLLQPYGRSPSTTGKGGCRGSVIVVPGGNYEFLCASEGMPVADWLAKEGFATFVLRYRLLPRYSYEDASADLAAAVRIVRRLGRGPVAAIGFSAGGHLVASHAVAMRKKGRKPLDAQVLVYPAIDGTDWHHPDKAGWWDQECAKKAHALKEGQDELLGGRGFAAPPTFLVASTEDSVCPARSHGDPFAAALQRRRVPHVYHRGKLGDHGFSLNGGWTEPCAEWLKGRMGRRALDPNRQACHPV